jgi:hypothetical protein
MNHIRLAEYTILQGQDQNAHSIPSVKNKQLRMKSNWIKNLIVLIMLLFSASCETDVEMVNAPEFKQKLVITAFISPSDDISFFRVTSNRKLYGELNTEEPLGLLSGSISDGLNEVALDTFKYGLKISHDKIQIQYGTRYTLRVSNEKGLNAEAECTIPARENIIMAADTFSIMKEQPPYSPDTAKYRSLNLKVKIPDQPGAENYYRIFGKFRGYSQNYTMTGYVTFNNEFISDKGMDGKNIAVNMNEDNSYQFSYAKDSLFINIYLYNTEKSYFLYHKSLLNYEDGENPFTEASPVYSNITGGFGIFTSFTVDSLVMRLK